MANRVATKRCYPEPYSAAAEGGLAGLTDPIIQG